MGSQYDVKTLTQCSDAKIENLIELLIFILQTEMQATQALHCIVNSSLLLSGLAYSNNNSDLVVHKQLPGWHGHLPDERLTSQTQTHTHTHMHAHTHAHTHTHALALGCICYEWMLTLLHANNPIAIEAVSA